MNKHVLNERQVLRLRIRKLIQRQRMMEFMVKVLIFIVVGYMTLFRIFGIAPIVNNDMSPRMNAGDVVFYYRLQKSYHVQDIVLYTYDGQYYVGRIIGKANDVMNITDDNHLQINGATVVESNIYYETPRYEGGIEFPLTVGEEEYFILADYREGGRDSRIFGAIKSQDIAGKIFSSVNRQN